MMSSPFRASALLAMPCLAFALACNVAPTNDDLGPSPQDAGSDSAPANGGADSAIPTPVSLAFTPTDTLALAPKATHTLTIQTTPPGQFPIDFALLGSGSDNAPGDAVLDASQVESGADGTAQVTLTAPSSPTTFSVRASVGGKVATTLAVSVSALGYTKLRVLHAYAGHRPVLTWTATARAGTSCSKLVGTPPPDGDLSISESADLPLDIAKVPIGVELAVTLRAGHYIGGCTTLPPLSEGDGNQVLVTASDRPLNLAATSLDLSFGPTQPKPALIKLLSATTSLVTSALRGTAKSDNDALLDAMQAAAGATNTAAFSAARTGNTWSTVLTALWQPDSAARLTGPAERWMTAGITRFLAKDAFAGQLTALPGGGLLKLTTVADVPPASAGFPSTFQVSWSADSNDTVLLGTELDWLPSRLATALAMAPALLEFPAATSADSALSLSVDCAAVGSALTAHGSKAGSEAYPGCNEACASSLCTTAVSALWKKARDASGATTATLGVTATGMAHVGDQAEAVDLDGSWLGDLQVGDGTAPASGTLLGSSTK